MSYPLTKIEIAGIERAQWAVRQIAGETPDCLEGPELVHALVCLLDATKTDPVKDRYGLVGIAAAAIAALVENERGQARGERMVSA